MERKSWKSLFICRLWNVYADRQHAEKLLLLHSSYFFYARIPYWWQIVQFLCSEIMRPGLRPYIVAFASFATVYSMEYDIKGQLKWNRHHISTTQRSDRFYEQFCFQLIKHEITLTATIYNGLLDHISVRFSDSTL